MDEQRQAGSPGDLIVIRDLLLRGIIGINEQERRKRQDILLNLELHADARAIAAADDVDQGVNYRTVTKEIIALVETSRFHTVERLAEEVARIILTGREVTEVKVSVEKPGALRFARSVGVTIVRRPADLGVTVQRAYLALGSNVDPERNYSAALRLLAGLGRVAAVSPVYETAAVGMPDAASFLNGAVLLETDDPPETCKRRLLSEVEDALGRVRPADGLWRARSIDVDIALWDDLVGEILGRPVPDPGIALHLHLARPLADLAPDLPLPGDGRTLATVAAELARRGGPLPLRRPEIKLDL